MKKNLLIISLIFVIPIVAYFIISKNSTSVAQKSPAASINAPVILKFTSSMCIDCKRLNEVIKVVCPKYSDSVSLETIMVESNDKDVIQKIKKHNVVLVPTLIFIDSNGKAVKKTEGYMDQVTFEKYVKELIDGKLR